MNQETLSNLTLDEIEEIEKLTLRWIFQAVLDFGMEAHEIFLKSPDKVKDIAEDITRELLDRLPGFNVQQRIYGNVDYKRARYIILPEKTVRKLKLRQFLTANYRRDTILLLMMGYSSRAEMPRRVEKTSEFGSVLLS